MWGARQGDTWAGVSLVGAGVSLVGAGVSLVGAGREAGHPPVCVHTIVRACVRACVPGSRVRVRLGPSAYERRCANANPHRVPGSEACYLLTPHHPPLTPHPLPLTPHPSPLTPHCIPFTAQVSVESPLQKLLTLPVLPMPDESIPCEDSANGEDATAAAGDAPAAAAAGSGAGEGAVGVEGGVRVVLDIAERRGGRRGTVR